MRKVSVFALLCALSLSASANEKAPEKEKRFVFGSISASVKQYKRNQFGTLETIFHAPYANTEYGAIFTKMHEANAERSVPSININGALKDPLRQRSYFCGVNLTQVAYKSDDFIVGTPVNDTLVNTDYFLQEDISFFETEIGVRFFASNDCESRMKAFLEPSITIPFYTTYDSFITKSEYIQTVQQNSGETHYVMSAIEIETVEDSQTYIGVPYTALHFQAGGQFRFNRVPKKINSWIFLQADNTLSYMYDEQRIDLSFLNFQGGIRLDI